MAEKIIKQVEPPPPQPHLTEAAMPKVEKGVSLAELRGVTIPPRLHNALDTLVALKKVGGLAAALEVLADRGCPNVRLISNSDRLGVTTTR